MSDKGFGFMAADDGDQAPSRSCPRDRDAPGPRRAGRVLRLDAQPIVHGCRTKGTGEDVRLPPVESRANDPVQGRLSVIDLDLDTHAAVTAEMKDRVGVEAFRDQFLEIVVVQRRLLLAFE
jgi:hypothetical protein